MSIEIDSSSASLTTAREEMTQSAKYIFLDVVQFTHNRNVEAQADIVKDLNKLVVEAVKDHGIADDNRIYIPTGDGLCIALLNTEGRYSYDIHMRIALKLLESLNAFNADEPDEMRRFEVRIGINANEDNLITDINGRPNLAGAGISLASRIMDKADGSQILVGESVFERLQQRERYMERFKPFWVTDKHGARFRLYQYLGASVGLSLEVPKAFMFRRNPNQ